MKQQAERVHVKIRATTGGTADVALLDISAGGCMVDFHGSAAKPGERVLVTLPGLSPLPGELIWNEDGRAGIAFESPLHETVYDRLKQMLAA